MNYSKPNFFHENAFITVAYQHYRESRHTRDFGEIILENRVEKVDAYSLNVDLMQIL